MDRSGVAPVVRINAAVLEAVLTTVRQLAPRVEASPPSLDGLLGAQRRDGGRRSRRERRGTARRGDGGRLPVSREAIAALAEMRQHEGAALGRMLTARLGEIAALAQRAELAPGRRLEAIRARLAEQVAALLAQSDRFDPDRLHQEAILIATKADVREELDRLAAHVAQARLLIGRAGRSAAGSISWRRNSIAKPIRSAPRPTTSSSPISAWN